MATKPPSRTPDAADAPADKPAKSAKPAKPRKKRRGLWIALVFVLLAGGGGAAWFAMAPATEASNAPATLPPVFVNLDTFTVNLQPENGSQYLQVAMTVKAEGDKAADAMKQQMPDIRNRLLLLLSSKRASDLLTVAGKEKLAGEILNQVRQPLPEADQARIAAVFFTSFVIQ